MEDVFLPIAVLFILFVAAPATIGYFILQFRNQKTMQPDDERMMEDLWRSAKAMEHRLETLEALLEAEESDTERMAARPPRSTRLD